MLDHIQDWSGDPGESLLGIGQLLRGLEQGDPVSSVSVREKPESREDAHEFVGAISKFARSCLLDVYPPDLDALLRGTTPEMQRFYLDALTYYSSEGDAEDVLTVDGIDGAEKRPECISILRYFLRNEIFSKEWYRVGDLRQGFALTLVRHDLTRAGARVLARRWGESGVTPKALSHSLSMVLRNLRGVLMSDPSPKVHAALDRIYTLTHGEVG